VRLLLLTHDPNADAVLPALMLLPHVIHPAPPRISAVAEAAPPDAVLVDARTDLMAARGLCHELAQTAPRVPVLAVVTAGGLSRVSQGWGLRDILLTSAGPAEIDARLRLAGGEAPLVSVAGPLVIDRRSHTARVGERGLELTHKEFELLGFLVAHPGRIFTREQLLATIWGRDYLGSARTVDVHIRRLRAKLGPKHERLIATVRNVGYRLAQRPGNPLLNPRRLN